MIKRFFWAVSLVVVFLVAGTVGASEDSSKESCESPTTEGVCVNDSPPSSTVRTIQKEELVTKNGEDDPTIWLSVMGKVYDVTAGSSFYAKGRSYGAFSGTDCSVCFVSGVFTAEEAAKDPSEMTDQMLKGLLDWVDFYGTHDTYSFVGYLVDPRFYDEKGEPTESLIALRKRMSLLQ